MSPVIADGRFTVDAIREAGFEIAIDSVGQVRILGNGVLPAHLRDRLKKHRSRVIHFLDLDQQATLTHLNFITFTASVFGRTQLAAIDEELESWCRRMRALVAREHQEKIDYYLSLCEATRENLEAPEAPGTTDLPAGWE